MWPSYRIIGQNMVHGGRLVAEVELYGRGAAGCEGCSAENV